MYTIEGFHSVLAKNRDTRGGGTTIQPGENVTLFERAMMTSTEALAQLVELNDTCFIIVIVYLLPRIDKKRCVEEYDCELEYLVINKVPIILAGNFKIHLIQKKI